MLDPRQGCNRTGHGPAAAGEIRVSYLMDTDGLLERVHQQHEQWRRDRDQDRLASMLPREDAEARRPWFAVVRSALARAGTSLAAIERLRAPRVGSARPVIDEAPDLVTGHLTT